MISRKIAVRVFDLRHRGEGGYTLMANWPTHPLVMEQSCNIIDLVAYCNHMRWMKLSTENFETDLREWKETLAAHLSAPQVIGWKEKMEGPQGESEERKVTPRRNCKQPVKQSMIPMGFCGGNTRLLAVGTGAGYRPM